MSFIACKEDSEDTDLRIPHLCTIADASLSYTPFSQICIKNVTETLKRT